MDYIIDYFLLKNIDGKIFFYPWGYSTYYIIPNARYEAKIRSFLKLFIAVMISLTILINATLKGFYPLLLIPAMYIGYFIGISQLTKGLIKHKYKRS